MGGVGEIGEWVRLARDLVEREAGRATFMAPPGVAFLMM